MSYNIADHVSHCLFTINIVYYTAPVILVTASVLYPGSDTYVVARWSSTFLGSRQWGVPLYRSWSR